MVLDFVLIIYFLVVSYGKDYENMFGDFMLKITYIRKAHCFCICFYCITQFKTSLLYYLHTYLYIIVLRRMTKISDR